MIAAMQRVLNRKVTIGALIELALWLAIPYLIIGLVWSSLHGEQVQQIQARLQQVTPTSTDIMAFGLVAVLWPASSQIADACPARS